jgi:hypothetical protein
MFTESEQNVCRRRRRKMLLRGFVVDREKEKFLGNFSVKCQFCKPRISRDAHAFSLFGNLIISAYRLKKSYKRL